MAFTDQQIERFHDESEMVLRDLQDLAFSGMAAAQGQVNENARLYLTQGVGRRVQVLRRALSEIFELFPPERTEPLRRDDLTTVQINLQAFVMNLAGVFDNWAWAYIFRHDLLHQVGGRLNVGMFRAATQDVLPRQLREYLQQDLALQDRRRKS